MKRKSAIAEFQMAATRWGWSDFLRIRGFPLICQPRGTLLQFILVVSSLHLLAPRENPLQCIASPRPDRLRPGVALGDDGAGLLVEVEPKERTPAPHGTSGTACTFWPGLGGLVVMFVSGIVMTYFIGTSRWCREVVGDLLAGPRATASQRGTQAANVPHHAGRDAGDRHAGGPGAAATPSEAAVRSGGLRGRKSTSSPRTSSSAFIVYASFVQWTNIRGNQEVIAAIMRRVGEVRREKGLE